MNSEQEQKFTKIFKKQTQDYCSLYFNGCIILEMISFQVEFNLRKIKLLKIKRFKIKWQLIFNKSEVFFSIKKMPGNKWAYLGINGKKSEKTFFKIFNLIF